MDVENQLQKVPEEMCLYFNEYNKIIQDHYIHTIFFIMILHKQKYYICTYSLLSRTIYQES